jgi:hypothetical protein
MSWDVDLSAACFLICLIDFCLLYAGVVASKPISAQISWHISPLLAFRSVF